MSRFNIRSLDLNLLAVFAIVWETRSVSRASERLALTQPAVSHALRRLRENTRGRTVRARPQGSDTDTSCIGVDQSGARRAGNDRTSARKRTAIRTRNSRREFRIATVDFAEFLMLPMLLQIISREAPNVVIREQPLPESGSAATLLEAGDVDVVVTRTAVERTWNPLVPSDRDTVGHADPEGRRNPQPEVSAVALP